MGNVKRRGIARTPFWHLYKKELLAFLWFCDMRWDKWVLKRCFNQVERRDEVGESTNHKSLEIWSPPLSEAVSNLPLIVDTMRTIKLL